MTTQNHTPLSCPRRCRYLAVAVAFFLTASMVWSIEVATLNCYLLFSPVNEEKTGMPRAAVSQEVYASKIANLASLVGRARPDVLALQEIGSRVEAEDLSKAIQAAWPEGGSWGVSFVQGKDTYTGQDVALLSRSSVKVGKAQRSPKLENLSKHLVVSVTMEDKSYTVVVVHLLRPIGNNKARHVGQITALEDFAGSTKSSPLIILGDFNSPDVFFPYLNKTPPQPTHVSGKQLDHIYSSTVLKRTELFKPPYGKRPNDQQRSTWTDHFLLFADIQ